MGDPETPLLQSIWHENCPGCKLEREKLQRKGSPAKYLFYIGVLVLANVLPISLIFPFLYFMVEGFHIAKDDKSIGYYAGIVGAAFLFGRFVTSSIWGLIADKYGRKPVFIIGTFSIVIFNTAFGFSTTFWMATLSRFLLGCFNGLLGPIRAYISEVCTEEYQALGMSMVGTCWGLGLIIGPAVGGYLSQPSLKYPKIFTKGSIFDQFQFLLPSVCLSAFAVVAVVVSFLLPESIHKHSKEVLDIDNFDNYCEESQKQHNSKDFLISSENKLGKVDEEKNGSALWNLGFISSMLVQGFWAVFDNAYAEVFSLWAVSPKSYGGLGFTTSNVGTVLSITGAFLLVCQFFLFPPASRILGIILTTRAAAMISFPLFFCYPLVAMLHGPSLWIVLVFISSVKNILSSCLTTATFLMVNNAVTMELRGSANGISLTVLSFFRTIGPAMAGALFSWTEKRTDSSFLPGTWMLFSILSLGCIITIALTFEPILPRSINKPKEENIEKINQGSIQDKQLSRPPSFVIE